MEALTTAESEVVSSVDWAKDNPPLSIHRFNSSEVWGLVILFGFLFAIGAVGIIFGISIVMYAEKSEPGFVLIGIGGVFAILGAWTLVRLLAANRGQFVVVFDKGLVWNLGGEPGNGRWEEITTVYRLEQEAVPSGAKTYLLTLVFNGDRWISFSEWFRQWVTLANTVQEKTYDLLWTASLSKLNRGEDVAFGELTVSRRELKYERKIYPLDEIDNIFIGNGCVVIRTTSGQSQMLYIYAIANFAVYSGPRKLDHQLSYCGGPGKGKR